MITPAPSCDVVCFVMGLADTAQGVFSSYLHITFVILGGLVVWVGFLIARWICHNGIGGGGRRFKR